MSTPTLHNSLRTPQQALGAGHQNPHPPPGAVSCPPGHRFLPCSEGIVDGPWDARPTEYVTPPSPDQPKAFKIVERAVAESGRDNCTAIVVELT